MGSRFRTCTMTYLPKTGAVMTGARNVHMCSCGIRGSRRAAGSPARQVLPSRASCIRAGCGVVVPDLRQGEPGLHRVLLAVTISVAIADRPPDAEKMAHTGTAGHCSRGLRSVC